METGKAGRQTARRMDVGGILFRRWLGCWIDFLTLGALVFAPALAAGILGVGKAPADTPVMLVVGSVAGLGYFPVTEGLWGRSLGKLITGKIVVDAAGRPPGVWRAVIRTLLRLVEVNPFLLGGLPAGIVVMATTERQRLGDLAAGTYVVPFKALAVARQTPSIADVFD